MSIEKHYSLSEAARLIGIDRNTLKLWLAEDLAMVMPTVRRGGKLLIRERDLEIVVRKRSPRSQWSLIRPDSQGAKT